MSSPVVLRPTYSSTTSRPSLRRRMRQRWGCVVVVATFALYFVLYGILFSYNVLSVAFQREFGSSATLTGWVGCTPLSISLMLSPVIQLASERFGYRSVSVFGIVLASTGIFVTSFLPSLLPMFVTYGLMGGIGAGIVTVCAFDIIVMYFPEKNTMKAVAIAVTGSTAGMLSLTQGMTLIITRYDWRINLRIMGALLFGVGLPCVLTYILPPDHHGNKTKKNKYCKVISKLDDGIIDKDVETLPDNPKKCSSNGFAQSPPTAWSKSDADSDSKLFTGRECNNELLPGSMPGYKVVDGLAEDAESLLEAEHRSADDMMTIEKIADDCRVISSDRSEDECVTGDGESALLDGEEQSNKLTMNCNVSSRTPRKESCSDTVMSDISNKERSVTPDKSKGCNGAAIPVGHDFEANEITMDPLKNFKQEWQSDEGSPATMARRYPCSDTTNNKKLVIWKEIDTMNAEEPLEHLQEPGMFRRISRALTFPELWLISVATIFNGIGDSFYYVNAIGYLMSVGFTEKIGVQFVSFTALAILVGKVSLVLIGEYLPFPRIFLQVISNVLSIIVVILLMIVRSVIPIYCVAAAAGITVAITNVVVFSLAPDFFGQERAIETSSMLYFCYGTGYLLGSLVGQSIDNTGSYVSALWAFIGMYTTSGIMLLVAPLYQRIFASERFVTYEIHRRKRAARRERKRLRKKDRHRSKISVGEIFVCEKVSSV